MRNKTHQLTLCYEINHYILLSSIFLRLPDTLACLIPIWVSSAMLHTRTVSIQRMSLFKATELLSAEARTRTLIIVHHSVAAHGWVPRSELVRVLTGVDLQQLNIHYVSGFSFSIFEKYCQCFMNLLNSVCNTDGTLLYSSCYYTIYLIKCWTSLNIIH